MQAQTALQNPAPETDIIDVDVLRNAQLSTFPYEHVVATDFIRPDWQERMLQGYPQVKTAGSFPLPTIRYGADFKSLIDELNGPAFRQAVEEKFSVDLKDKPTMFTVRGRCRLKDGQVHTDSLSKIITVLLYMNPPWEKKTGGKLRVLRSNDVDDVVTEISPDIGTLLVFKRADNSWHGHLPYEGERRVIQMNWVTHQKYVDREQQRHGLSSWIKGLWNGY